MKSCVVFLVFLFGSRALLGITLFPAKTNGNPSFQIGVGFNDPATSQAEHTCQATLINHVKKSIGWGCSIVTAAHCVLDESRKNLATTFFTADFGVIKNPSIKVKGRDLVGGNDIAVVHFSSSACSEKAKELLVEVGNLPAGPTDRMGVPILAFVASATFSTVFSMVLPSNYTPTSGVIEGPLGSGDINGVRQTFATYTGDSGGGVFLRKNAASDYSLIGVISEGVHYIGPRLKRGAEIEHSMGSDKTVFVSDVGWVRDQIGDRDLASQTLR